MKKIDGLLTRPDVRYGRHRIRAAGHHGSADKSAAKAPLMTLKGKVKVDGDKVMFVNDKDSKSWDVMNPEELKAHDGHHVQLSAHVYADKSAIHVMSVKMLK